MNPETLEKTNHQVRKKLYRQLSMLSATLEQPQLMANKHKQILRIAEIKWTSFDAFRRAAIFRKSVEETRKKSYIGWNGDSDKER